MTTSIPKSQSRPDILSDVNLATKYDFLATSSLDADQVSKIELLESLLNQRDAEVEDLKARLAAVKYDGFLRQSHVGGSRRGSSLSSPASAFLSPTNTVHDDIASGTPNLKSPLPDLSIVIPSPTETQQHKREQEYIQVIYDLKAHISNLQSHLTKTTRQHHDEIREWETKFQTSSNSYEERIQVLKEVLQARDQRIATLESLQSMKRSDDTLAIVKELDYANREIARLKTELNDTTRRPAVISKSSQTTVLETPKEEEDEIDKLFNTTSPVSQSQQQQRTLTSSYSQTSTTTPEVENILQTIVDVAISLGHNPSSVTSADTPTSNFSSAVTHIKKLLSSLPLVKSKFQSLKAHFLALQKRYKTLQNSISELEQERDHKKKLVDEISKEMSEMIESKEKRLQFLNDALESKQRMMDASGRDDGSTVSRRLSGQRIKNEDVIIESEDVLEHSLALLDSLELDENDKPQGRSSFHDKQVLQKDKLVHDYDISLKEQLKKHMRASLQERSFVGTFKLSSEALRSSPKRLSTSPTRLSSSPTRLVSNLKTTPTSKPATSPTRSRASPPTSELSQQWAALLTTVKRTSKNREKTRVSPEKIKELDKLHKLMERSPARSYKREIDGV